MPNIAHGKVDGQDHAKPEGEQDFWQLQVEIRTGKGQIEGHGRSPVLFWVISGAT